jgi:glycerol-3-phosphate dehydrogenase
LGSFVHRSAIGARKRYVTPAWSLPRKRESRCLHRKLNSGIPAFAGMTIGYGADMTYDLLIIGGGINGTAIAREAARNGLSTLLVERDDLASHTSSASTKLIHGGLRYLEHYEFRLVRHALKERTLLMRAAPHLIEPMQFILPQAQSSRPWLMVRAGLLLYDLLAGRSPLPWARRLKSSDSAFQKPLKNPGSGFVYSDCKVDDSRLTILNAVDAARHGANIRTRTAMLSARREGELWHVSLSDGNTVSARALANAAGPWVSETLALTGSNSKSGILLVKGSHIVVPRLYEGDHAYFLQQDDGRIVFVAPWAGGATMVGTTDVTVDNPGDAQIDPSEIAYLCAAANAYFTHQIAESEISYTWSGIRPLYNDGASAAQEVTRDYVLEVDANGPPILSVFGGKITTARYLAEEALAKLAAAAGWNVSPKTRDAPLPGGDFSDFEAFLAAVTAQYPFLGPARARRMARAYGSLLSEMLAGAESMGEEFGSGLSAVEVDWLVSSEWAQTAEDILWRRSKLGLGFAEEGLRRLEAYLLRRPQNRL